MTSTRPGKERRQAQRVRLVQGLTGTEESTGAQVRLSDMSRDAFALESSLPFSVGSVLEFTFDTTGGAPLILHGKVRRCERSGSGTRAGKFLAGFSFAWKTPSDRAAAQAVIRTFTRGAV